MSKRYLSLSHYFKDKMGKKIVKLSLETGLTCPNRDGTLDTRGCIFCSAGGSGEHAGVIGENHMQEIRYQIESQKKLLASKWTNVSYLAYFQSYSNTYGNPNQLRKLYNDAFSAEGIEGLCVATRADCIDEHTIEVFKEQLEKGVFWVEIGLQSIHKKSIEWMRRHYGHEIFEATYSKLKAANIPVVVHLIIGLPGEKEEDFIETIKYVNAIKPFGVKFHMLNALKGTDLEHMSLDFLLSKDDYIRWVTLGIGWLDPEIVIHRLTGDGPKSLLLEPKWILNKRAVLNGIEKSLKQNNIVQGCYIT